MFKVSSDKFLIFIRLIFLFIKKMGKFISFIFSMLKYFILFLFIYVLFSFSSHAGTNHYLIEYIDKDLFIPNGCQDVRYNTNLGFFAGDIFVRNGGLAFLPDNFYFTARDNSQLLPNWNFYPVVSDSTSIVELRSRGGTYSFLECFNSLISKYPPINYYDGWKGYHYYGVNIGSVSAIAVDEFYNIATITYTGKQYLQAVFISLKDTDPIPEEFVCSDGNVTTYKSYNSNTYVMCSANHLIELDKTCLSFFGTKIPVYVEEEENDGEIHLNENYPLVEKTVKNFGEANDANDTIYCGLSLYELVSTDLNCKYYTYMYDGTSYTASDYEIGLVPQNYKNVLDPQCEYLTVGGVRPPSSGEDLNVDVNLDDILPDIPLEEKDPVYDDDGFNDRGFDRDGNNKDTGTKYDPDGFDNRGFDNDGKYRDGSLYNDRGFDVNGIHKDTGTGENSQGDNEDVINASGARSSLYTPEYPDGIIGVYNNSKDKMKEGKFGEFMNSFNFDDNFSGGSSYPVYSIPFSKINSDFEDGEIKLDNVSGYNVWLILKTVFLFVSMIVAFKIAL